MRRLAGFTSTGSKHPQILYGNENGGTPSFMQRSSGAHVWDDHGNQYLDFLMALGAVSLGYADPQVNLAVIEAVNRGGIGPLAPVDEELLAEEIVAIMPHVESVRFLKTGAEAVAAAIRLARVCTGRTEVIGCGYHGWLDWCSSSAGVPAEVRSLYSDIPFNDSEQAIAAIRLRGDRLACVVIEPVIEMAPDIEWLRVLREETARVGALLIYDEIKTAFRVGLQGAAGKWGGDPDLVVMGKALANGYPLAAVGGTGAVVQHVGNTWISSTMATEFVSIAAARATLQVMQLQDVPTHLERLGTKLLAGLQDLATRYPATVAGAFGIPQMCYLRYRDEAVAAFVTQAAATHGLLFKRNAYNFVASAHRPSDVADALSILEEALKSC